MTIGELLQDMEKGKKYKILNLYFEKYIPDYGDVYYSEEYGGKIIQCSDGEVYVFARPSAYYDHVAKAVAVIGAAICFFVILMPYIIHIIHRITRLSKEMEILAGDELSYRVISSGSDELAELGWSIEGMRCSVLEQMARENQAVLANNNLITSLSHDLRTPLTKLMGYLEIMQYQKYKNEAERKAYLRKAVEKARQMQMLSNEMFRDFQVRREPVAESISGSVLLSQMLEDQCYDLQADGYTASPPVIEGNYKMQVRIAEVQRIFDNLFSNLKKSAGESESRLSVLCFQGITDGW